MKKILVIDDEPALLKSIRIVLEQCGYNVTIADDGIEGLELYDKGEFDLVITDILMPNKDGIKTISHIRKTNKAIPILAISGAHETGTMNNLNVAMMVGATMTLAKPFERNAFIGTVEECLSIKTAFKAF